jgi:hypothetical protein
MALPAAPLPWPGDAPHLAGKYVHGKANMTRWSPSSTLPLQHEPTAAWRLSLVAAILIAGMSLVGLVFSAQLYPSAELVHSFVSNDAANLVIGLPILLGAQWLARRGKWIGLLCWPGALLYSLYNYVAYIFGTPFGLATAFYLAIVLISAYALFDLLQAIDAQEVMVRLAGIVPVKTGGVLLLAFGGLFFFQALSILAGSLNNLASLPLPELGVLIADLVLSLGWIAGGALLFLGKPLGYASALGLLFAACALIIGLILVLFLQPVLTTAPFSPSDAITVFMLGLIVFIPFWLFARPVLAVDRSLVEGS